MNLLVFISDHPLNKYKNYFDQFQIKNYLEFSKSDNLETNIANNIKNSGRKTNKGNSYAIIKFSDLSTFLNYLFFQKSSSPTEIF